MGLAASASSPATTLARTSSSTVRYLAPQESRASLKANRFRCALSRHPKAAKRSRSPSSQGAASIWVGRDESNWRRLSLLSRWLLWARNREHGGGGGRRHQGVMAGLVPAIPEGPAHRRRQARKALRPSAFLPVAPRRDSFLRRPGVDGRDKPGHDGKGSTNEQQTGRPTDNAIRAKSRALIALAVVGKESGAWRRWRTAPSRRHGRACPGHPRRPSASTQASAKSLATVRLPAGRAEAGLVLAAARRGWPGQARP